MTRYCASADIAITPFHLSGMVCAPPGISADRHSMDHGVVPEARAAMGNGRIDVWHYHGWIFIGDTVRACVVARHDLHVRIGA